MERRRALPALALLCFLQSCSPVGPHSDEGGRLLFFSRVPTGNLQLFTANVDGSDVVRLVNDRADYTGPDWSPDGRQIVFASTRGGNANFDLYAMNADGSGIRRIHGTPDAEFAPSWSPVGDRIAFQHRTNVRSGWDIYTVKVDGTDLRRITDSLLDDELPDWSPDGSRIVYQAGRTTRNIYTIRSDGTDLQQLTAYTNTVLGAPAWSPDGSRIAFNSTLHQIDTGERSFGEYEIYVMDTDGSNLRQLTHLSGPDRAQLYPSWSPGSKSIVFQSDQVFNDELIIARRVGFINADGTDLREVELGQFARFPRLSAVQ